MRQTCQKHPFKEEERQKRDICVCLLVQIALPHELWALNDIHVGGWHASCTRSSGMLLETRTLTGSLACFECAPYGLAAVNRLVDLTIGGNSWKRYTWPSGLLTLYLPSPFTSVFLSLSVAIQVWTCFFSHCFDVIRWDLANWNCVVQRCLEGVNHASF